MNPTPEPIDAEPSPPAAAPAAPPVPLRGALLRAAREAGGLSQADMAARLRLSLRQIQALEDDEDAALPPAPFVRGFVRNYARALGRDPAEFESELPVRETALPAQPPSLAPPQPQRQVLLESGRASANRRWLVAALVALVLAGLGSWLRLEHLQTAEDLIARQAPASIAQWGALVGAHRESPAAGAPAPATASGARPDGSVERTLDAAADAAPGPTASIPVAAGPAAAAPTASAHEDGSAAARAAPVSVSGAPGRKLALDFDADCWVEVRDENNQVLLSGVSRAGDHRDLEAHGPVRIVVGNAPATRLSWNGRPVDLAEFTRLTVARLTLDPAADTP